MGQRSEATGKHYGIIILAIIGVILSVLIGGWVVGGHMTTRITWTGHGGGMSRGNMPQWYEPRHVAVMALGEGTGRAYATAIRDELRRRGWVKDVTIIEPGQAESGRVDFFICVGEPVMKVHRDGLRWHGEVEINLTGGTRPLPDEGGGLGLPLRNMRFDLQWEGKAEGWAMAVSQTGEETIAAKLADYIESLLNPAACEFSPARPMCFPDAAEAAAPKKIAAVEQSGAKLIWAGPGYMQRQRAYWLLVSSESKLKLLTRFADELRTEGWQVHEEREHRYDPQTGQSKEMELSRVSAERERELLHIEAAEPWQQKHFPIQPASGEQMYFITYTDRFSRQRIAKIIDDLLDAGPIDHGEEFEPLMNDAQQLRLIAQMEQSPVETGKWYSEMANRYFRVSKDAAKAEAALRHARTLAVRDRDYELLCLSIPRLGRDMKLAELSRPPTTEQLQAMGAKNLQNGPAEVEIKTGERGVTFIHINSAVVLVNVWVDAIHEAHFGYWTASDGSGWDSQPLTADYTATSRLDGWKFTCRLMTMSPMKFQISAENTRP